MVGALVPALFILREDPSVTPPSCVGRSLRRSKGSSLYAARRVPNLERPWNCSSRAVHGSGTLSLGAADRVRFVERSTYFAAGAAVLPDWSAATVHHDALDCLFSLIFKVEIIRLASWSFSSRFKLVTANQAASVSFGHSGGVPFLKRLQLDLALSGEKLLKLDARWPNEHHF